MASTGGFLLTQFAPKSFFLCVLLLTFFFNIEITFLSIHLFIDRNSSCVNDKNTTSPTHTKCMVTLNDTKNSSTSISRTVYETCLDYSCESIKQATDRIYQQVKRSPLNSILARLSISAGASADVEKGDRCDKCGRSGGRSNLLTVPSAGNKTRTNMMTSTPIMKDVGYNADFFKVIHVEKTELHDLSPRVTDYHGKYI